MTETESHMTAAALTAYYNPSMGNPHMWSSSMWFAFEAGRHMWFAGLTSPRKVKMSRGYTVRVETAATRFLVRFEGKELDRIRRERMD